MTRREFHRSLVCFTVASPILATGCDSGPKIVAVSGVVLIDGQPLTHGVVQVVPAGYRPAMAQIGQDGHFTLGTHEDKDGVVVGTHKVAVIAHKTLGPGSQMWMAPKHYMDADTSGLTITVDKEAHDVEIKLTWKDDPYGKPWVEYAERE